MAGDWNVAGWARLLMAIHEELGSSEDDGGSQPWESLEDVTQLDAAERGRAYDEAITRALAAARPQRHRARKDAELIAKAMGHIRTRASGIRSRYFGLPLAEAYLALSAEVRYSDPARMLSYAESACRHARNTPLEERAPGVILNLRARTCAELSNAYRVNDRFDKAEGFLAEAKRWLEEGPGDLGLLGCILDLEASLRIDQRQHGQALELLDQAFDLYMELGELHLAGRTRINKARSLNGQGDPAAAVLSLEEALSLIDRKRDPGLVDTCKQSLISYLVDCREYARAGELLLEGGLHQAFAEEPLKLLRLRWVEGKIHVGMGRLDRAGQIFQEVRQGFREHVREYDAALVGLDLAGVWLRHGEHGRVQPLAEEMAQTFRRLQVPEAAWQAVALLELLCRTNRLRPWMVERTHRFLVEVRDDPTLPFEVDAVFG
jgi:tetratricopeptide (TPR) repeat protein